MHLEQSDTRYPDLITDDFLSGSSLKTNHGDWHIRINISRNTLLAVAFSLILHVLIFFFVPKIQIDNPPASPATTILVSLAQPKSPEPVIESAPVVIEEKPVNKIEKPTTTPRPAKTANPIPATPEVIATHKPTPENIPLQQPKVNELPAEQFTDMASYVKAMQAKRQGSEFDAARQNAMAVARERGPSEEQLREERIKRNFQNGTNGIFEITSLSERNATFAFRGWTNDYSASKRQFFEVEAQSGQDVRLVMIRRMIALIREHYQGDFNWESHRLGRSVIQSARPEDSAGLEDFLMMEFFGTNYKSLS